MLFLFLYFVLIFCFDLLWKTLIQQSAVYRPKHFHHYNKLFYSDTLQTLTSKRLINLFRDLVYPLIRGFPAFTDLWTPSVRLSVNPNVISKFFEGFLDNT